MLLKLGCQIGCSVCYSMGKNVCSINFSKKIHTTKLLKKNPLSYEEIKIPVAWGHIAGKWWGNTSVEPVLAVHGVQDNAATFDSLVPLLNVESLLAVDMPGHGWSSHLPTGFPYDYMDAVCILRFVIKHHFNWSKPVVLLGHSFGSNLSFVYSALYPGQVSKYISLDCSRHHMSEHPNKMIPKMRATIEKMLSLEKKHNPPEYSYDELLELMFKGRKGPEGWITKEACKILLSRGTSKLSNGKVYLSRDPRVKCNSFKYLTYDTWLNLSDKITCTMLSIQAENGVVRNDFKGEMYKKTVETVLKNSQKSRHVVLPGYHHVHLDDPQIVAKEINQFLSS